MQARAAMSVEGEAESSPPVLSVEGARATIRLNRPKHLNRIQPEDLATLVELLGRVEADNAIRVLVVTGTGRVFSAGYDLGDISNRTTGAQEAPSDPGDKPGFSAMVDQLENLAVPTICRLNGGVYGGATDLALACDFRIGPDTCEMFMPAARLGLHYYASGIRRYVERLGPSAAKHLFLTAEKIGAAEMLRIGYLTDVVPAAELDARVDALAASLTASAPVATRGMKRAINEIARGALDAEAADRRHVESLRSVEIKEGVRAFQEKRKPIFAD